MRREGNVIAKLSCDGTRWPDWTTTSPGGERWRRGAERRRWITTRCALFLLRRRRAVERRRRAMNGLDGSGREVPYFCREGGVLWNGVAVPRRDALCSVNDGSSPSQIGCGNQISAPT